MGEGWLFDQVKSRSRRGISINPASLIHELNKSASLASKLLLERSVGFCKRLKSPNTAHGPETLPAIEASSARKRGLRALSHGPYTFVTVRARSEIEEEKVVVREEEPRAECVREKSVEDQAIMMPPEAPREGRKRKD
jgi:hypothetical protein